MLRRVLVLFHLITAGVGSLTMRPRVPAQPTHAFAAAHHRTCSSFMNADTDDTDEGKEPQMPAPPAPVRRSGYNAMADIQSFMAVGSFKGFNASTPLGFAGASTTVCGIWVLGVEIVKFLDANPASPSVFGSINTILPPIA